MSTPAYVLAHRELPERFFAGPHELVELLAGDRGDVALAAVWEELGGDEGEPPDVELLDPASGRQMVIVAIPAASAAGEAALVALVVGDGGQQPGYYTLEHSIDLGDGPATMLCQRDSDGRHLNHGLGPAAKPRAFADAVLALAHQRTT